MKELIFQLIKKGLRKFKRNNSTVGLNILSIDGKEINNKDELTKLKEQKPGYISKFNSKRENQIILLTTSNSQK